MIESQQLLRCLHKLFPQNGRVAVDKHKHTSTQIHTNIQIHKSTNYTQIRQYVSEEKHNFLHRKASPAIYFTIPIHKLTVVGALIAFSSIQCSAVELDDEKTWWMCNEIGWDGGMKRIWDRSKGENM